MQSIVTHNMQALVVDDEPGVCWVMSRLLRDAGIRSLETQGGEEALARLTELGPNVVGLVVTDLAMPRMSGSSMSA